MRRLLVAVALAAGATTFAAAQDFPTKPVTMVVPFTPGGSTDIVARMVAEGMKPGLGQPVIIENVGGAGGIRAPRAGGVARKDVFASVE